MIGLNEGKPMAGTSSKGAMRLLDLRGQTWWFKKAIPAECRNAFKGQGTYLVNLRTSDVRVAKGRRDELDAECTEYFRQVRTGEQAATLSGREKGLLYRETLRTLAHERATDGQGEFSPYDIALTAAEEAAERLRGRERQE